MVGSGAIKLGRGWVAKMVTHANANFRSSCVRRLPVDSGMSWVV